MFQRRALLCALVLLMLTSIAVAEEAIKDRVVCYTTWDSTYFYLAFKVDSPDVQATQTKPNTDLAGDDTVEFYIETDNKLSQKISPACFSMTVSAAGGSRFKAGNDKGVLAATPAYTFKYGTVTQGTRNNADDIDMGYSVEMAIPWTLLNTKPPSLGDMMSFNVIVRRHGDKAGSFVSLSPRVKNEEDAVIPANWVKVVYAAHTFGVATMSVEKILSAKYVVHSPLIDGVVNDREWYQNTSFSIDLPMPPGFVYEAKFPVQRMVFAKYLYWYQADARKPVPVAHIKKTDGSLDMADTPVKGIGPWFSYDRAQWHKDELSSMITSGINVALPDYLGAGHDSFGYADKGLDCMVAALEELRKENKPYPMVGLYLDASLLGNQDMYSAIKSFFDRVPPEFRAYAPAAKPNAGKPGAIIYVAKAKSLDAWTPAILTACSDRFQKDFGCPLIWVGDSSLAQANAGFDAIVGSAASRISAEAVTSDDSYDTQWTAVLEKNPLWVICDAWNDFTSGKCICATSKLGTRRVDSTKAHVKRFLVSRDYSARILRFDVPEVIPPKQIVQAEVTIRNAGNSTWRSADGYALGYRWYRNGRFYGESKVRRPLTDDVAPGDTVTVNIGIATLTAANTILPEGPCELRLELIRLSDNKWFSALGDLPLMVPITIGQPAEFDASILSCSTPNMAAIGGTYPAIVRVRNDGTQTWRADATKLDCKLFKIARDNADASATEAPISALRATLKKNCKPGEIAEFQMEFVVAPGSKKSLDVSKPDDASCYRLKFDLVNGSKQLSEAGVALCSRAIDLSSTDYGPRIVDCDIARNLTIGQSVEVKVVFRNTGTVPWDKKQTKIGYRWYLEDGTELNENGIMTPVKTTVQPGWPVVTQAKVQAPMAEGKYTLVWDVMIGDKWLSTGSLSRGGDILSIPVEVTKEPIAPVVTPQVPQALPPTSITKDTTQ